MSRQCGWPINLPVQSKQLLVMYEQMMIILGVVIALVLIVGGGKNMGIVLKPAAATQLPVNCHDVGLLIRSTPECGHFVHRQLSGNRSDTYILYCIFVVILLCCVPRFTHSTLSHVTYGVCYKKSSMWLSIHSSYSINEGTERASYSCTLMCSQKGNKKEKPGKDLGLRLFGISARTNYKRVKSVKRGSYIEWCLIDVTRHII